jgi:C-terminal processing protease CtpA/Prc
MKATPPLRPRRPGKALALAALSSLLLLAPVVPPARAQTAKLNDIDRQRMQVILNSIKGDLKKYYYDPTFRGIDIDALFRATEEKVKQAPQLSHAYRVVAQALLALNDSHTYFDPPGRTISVDYGWRMQIIGDKCYLTGVRPQSDAEAKGLKPGDRVLSIDGYAEPTRADLWKMKYVYFRLDPRAGVSMVVAGPDGKQRKLDVMAKVRQGKLVTDLEDQNSWDEFERQDENMRRFLRHRHQAEGDLFIWKMPQFDTAQAIDDVMGKARKFKSLVIDMRGNSGGETGALERLVGYFFDRDLKIADVKGRKEMKPLVAKTRGANVFPGKLVVLVDSESASAAEVFARVVQLEKRGTVIGDSTIGMVMGSRYYSHQLGADRVAYFGMSVTEIDLIMKDGVSLENVGVKPDEVLLPSAQDLAAQRDPVLARAAALLGVTLTPERAGSLFPQEWPKL